MRLTKITKFGGLVLAIGVAAAGAGLLMARASADPPPGPQEAEVRSEPRAAEGQEPDEQRAKWIRLRTEQDLAEVEYEATKELLRQVLLTRGRLEIESAESGSPPTGEQKEQFDRALERLRDAVRRQGREIHEGRLVLEEIATRGSP